MTAEPGQIHRAASEGVGAPGLPNRVAAGRHSVGPTVASTAH